MRPWAWRGSIPAAIDTALQRISNDLFDLGADLCTPDMEKDAEAPTRACG